MKARAALYFGDYALAETTAKEVMDKGGFSLFKILLYSEAQKKEAEEMSLYIDFEEKESIKTNSLRVCLIMKLCGIQKMLIRIIPNTL